jgi:tRNA(fMet)-specific endonuclease VapC
LYILDTDHVSLLLEDHPQIKAKTAEQAKELAITIVTVQELFNGWISRLNHPAEINRQVILYAKLSTVVKYVKKTPVLDFDQLAEQRFRQLLTAYPQLRKNRLQKDMRIAAIALSRSAIVVTRNYRDFSQVPNLRFEDWSTDSNF